VQGRVDRYSTALGYGFILPNGGDTKVLVCHTEIADDGSRSLGNSVKVLYEVIQGREGMEAKNARKV
jgi:cold shock CspA family protein